MARHIIESLSGVGDIYSGNLLLRAATQYQLLVWSDDDPPREGDDHGKAATIEGTVAVTGIGESVVLAGAETLTLKLQDGRRLEFSLTSSAGHIVGRGGIQPA